MHTNVALRYQLSELSHEFTLSLLEPEGRSHGNIELVYSPPSEVKSAGLSTVGLELSRESVGTMWEAAETKVKGDGGSDRQIEETFLEMISELVNSSTSIQLKVIKIMNTFFSDLQKGASSSLATDYEPDQ